MARVKFSFTDDNGVVLTDSQTHQPHAFDFPVDIQVLEIVEAWNEKMGYKYANLGQALPPRRGKNLLVETTLEQIGAFTDAVVGSGLSSLSHRMVSPWFCFVSHAWGRRPELHYHDTLDWDAHIGTPPNRKSGTLRVSLKYGGRAKPIAIEDAWD